MLRGILPLLLASTVRAGLFDWAIPVGGGGSLSGGGGAAPPLQPPAWVEPYDPLPLKGTQVAHGSARFTVLAPALIRMEWSPHTPPRFHDAGTYFAVNRRFAAAPKYEWAIASGVLTITTAALTLRYEPSAGTPGAGFQPSTLSVTLADGRVWRSGDEPTGSLHGTIRTLDRVGKTVGLGCTQPAYMNDSHCEEGVVSLDGWAVIDDTMGARWDTTNYRAEAGAGKWPWVTGPAESPAAPPGAPPDAAQCLPTGFSRFECLWGNVVDEAGCRARGCCFDAEAAASAQGVPPAIHMTPWCFWPTPAPGTSGYTDLYFFGHGWDFRGALRDFTGLGGRPPLLPRWALGPFFSRWFAYADHEERAVLAMHARNGIPLDVQVLDTDWHMGWWHAHGFPPHPPRYPEGTPPNAHAIQWTGWDVNEHLLPAVKRLHAHIHARGVATGWNFHLPPYVGFSGGVQYVDSVYKELCAALGLEWEEGEPVLGDYSNKTWSEAFFRVAMVPLLVGLDVDFAWPDWQQGEWTRMLGLAPTPWLSYVFASFPQFTRAPLLAPTGSGSGGGAHQQQHLPSARSHSARSLVLNRWGGLGAHRYPVGFSGDAETTWEVLALQVYITSTAANVAFQWSHDIGGFAGNPDPEIMTRWVQLGVFSPILRPHCAGRGGNSRDIWKFEWNAFEIMRSYFRLRARLIPYLYTAQRAAYATGTVPVHGMYYDYPRSTSQGAFSPPALHQYAFGPSLWVAPITSPAPEGSAGLTPTRVWFPPGPWWEWGSWQAHHGGEGPVGATYPRAYALEETPLFSPPGAIIPLSGDLDSGSGGGEQQGDYSEAGAGAAYSASPVGSGVRVPASIVYYVLPPPQGTHLRPSAPPLTYTSTLYDDDGVSTAYTAGGYAWSRTTCAWGRNERGIDSVECEAAVGGSSSGSSSSGSGGGGGDGGALQEGEEVERGSEGYNAAPPIASPQGFTEAPARRTLTFRFLAAWPPSSVSVGGEAVPFAPSARPDAGGEGGAWGGGSSWSYHGDTASVWVRVGAVAWGGKARVRVAFPVGGGATEALLGSALARKIARAQGAKGAMNRASWTVNPCDVPSLLRVAGAGARVEAAVGEAFSSSSSSGGGRMLEAQPPAASAMLGAVRGIYGSLGEDLKKALEEVKALLDRKTMGVEETAAVEDMRKLIENALA